MSLHQYIQVVTEKGFPWLLLTHISAITTGRLHITVHKLLLWFHLTLHDSMHH